MGKMKMEITGAIAADYYRPGRGLSLPGDELWEMQEICRLLLTTALLFSPFLPKAFNLIYGSIDKWDSRGTIKHFLLIENDSIDKITRTY